MVSPLTSRIPRAWRVVGLVSVWHVAASLCYYVMYVAPPYFRDSFGFSPSRIGVLLAVVALGYTTSLLPIGAIVDSVGEKYVLTTGLLGLSAGVIAILLIPSPVILFGIAFWIGVCYGTATPGTNKAIFTKVPLERRNFGMGIKMVGNIAGVGLCGVILTWLATTRYGWPGGFGVVAALGVLTAIVFYWRYGAGDSALSVEIDLPNVRGLVQLRGFVLVAIAGVFLGSLSYTSIGYTVLYIDESVGLAVGFAGFVFASMQVAGGAGRFVSGWIGDRVPTTPTHWTLTILLVQTIGAITLLVGVPLVAGQLGVFIAFMLLGFFALGTIGMYFSCIGTIVPMEESGSASALGQLSWTFGGLVTPPVFGYLAEHVSYRAAWWLLAGLAGVALVILIVTFLVVRPTADPTPAPTTH